MYEILAARYIIADELRCVHILLFVHEVVLLSVLLDFIGVHGRFLYWEESQIIELVVKIPGTSTSHSMM